MKMPPVWTDLAEAAALVQDGDLVALGGHTRRAPMALIRELIRKGRRDLGLVTVPTGGLNVDLLIGAGTVSRLHFAQVSLEEYGLAPNFRRAVEQGRLTCFEYP
jgi:glutaconate CoA-transferase subunit A